jgi:hypothetical protein
MSLEATCVASSWQSSNDATTCRNIAPVESAPAMDVDDADPRPVHDRVPHVDRHHIGSSPDGARPVHEWIVYIMNFFTL